MAVDPLSPATRATKRNLLVNRRLTVSLYGVRALYFVRAYIVDGFLPLTLALVAFAALFHLRDLRWLPNLMPNAPA
jgi:hypothetical protein